MANRASADVSLRDPQVDDRLRFQERNWEVTERSTYQNEEGYRVIEWCCETSNTEAYLLKEFEDNKPPRWFFTRWVSHKSATVDGTSLATWIKNHPSENPPGITFQNTLYSFADKTEGTYDNEDLGKQKKITWDFWDKDHSVNMAVELWENGEIDLYRGTYVRPEELVLLQRQTSDFMSGVDDFSENPQSAAIGLLYVSFILFLVAGFMPFETMFAWAVGLASLVGALVCFIRLSALSFAAAGLAVVAFFIFGRAAPLSTVAGIVTVLGFPLAFSLHARRQGYLIPRAAVLYLAGWTTAWPILVHGFYIYFNYAPGPRTFGELLIAIGPAIPAGIFGALIAHKLVPSEPEPGVTACSPWDKL